LTIEDPNTIDSKLVDALPLISLVAALLRKPKWEKKLSKLLSISALDTRETSLLLPVEIRTIDMGELYSVEALLDCRATRSLIDRDFVYSKGMNTQTLSHNILVFNVNGSSNKAGQISEVVNIVLCYKSHSERMLLAISGLGKQNLILGYNWLKDHNPKIDWEKGKVEITHCPLCCEGECVLQKEQTRQKKIKLRALQSCCNEPTPLLQEELEPEKKLSQAHHLSWELRNQLFLTHLLPEPDQVDLQAMTTISQHLMEGARHSAETQATATLLPTYVTEFQFMFFRMTNSPATFQTMMNDVFRTVIAEGIIVVYLDDILIFTKMKEEHE